MRSALILALAVVCFISTMSASSALTWTNDIVLEEDGMSWDYTESYKGQVATAYRSFIDSEVGNNDDHVSAWELMKVDYFIRNRLRTSLEEELDVKFDSSSKNVHVTDVDAEIALGVLGSTSKADDIANMYFVTYDFEKNFFDMGSSMSFEGEPDTEVTITMPEGAELISYDGIRIKTIDTKENRTEIKGFFEDEGKITIDFARDEPKPEAEDDVESEAGPETEVDEAAD
ncbi:hypothetical protein [Methanococcoides methylutens]|uniref:Uncharacterized protein n=1 Tax=Methanococcoides methylutens MM1 TaxID=1434104 RepID=A0A0E3SSK3_METMT|nr:hypothetical protein [Methanococcoides methylutens]AKB86171.1 hypothetical protein MCMEM_2118 [Methanococcoides methylutens MM1]